MSFDLKPVVGHKLWNMTRPTRRLATIIEAMPILQKVAEGKAWDRSRQREFEDELGKSRVKAHGDVRSDSGGNRTWAVYPKIFGLWYEEDGKVKLTQAAEKIIEGGEEAISQLRHQILRFQWPNRTQEHRSQHMDDDFKIFPYRFLIKLMLDPRIKYLQTSEIALFVIQAKNENELEVIIKNILKYRKKSESDAKTLRERSDLIHHHKKFRPSKSSDPGYTDDNHWQYIIDLADTFMNHLELFEEIVHEQHIEYGRGKPIFISEDKIEHVKRLIARYDKEFPLSSLGKHDDAKWFVKNYGNRYDRHKSSKKTAVQMTKKEKDDYLVKNAYDGLSAKNLTFTEEQIISQLSRITGKRESEIQKIVSSNPTEFNFYQTGKNNFAKKYLECAPDGDRNIEFEEMTREIFVSFGFPVEKLTYTIQPTGNQLKIDGFVQNENNLLSGIIDAKSGKKFSCDNPKVGIMKDYIERFKEYKHKDKLYHLDFFAYIYGKEFTNRNNFARIIKETGIHGAIISAPEILRLKEKFDQGKISKEKIWELFKKDGEIMS